MKKTFNEIDAIERELDLMELAQQIVIFSEKHSKENSYFKVINELLEYFLIITKMGGPPSYFDQQG